MLHGQSTETSTGAETLGKRAKTQTDWLSPSTWNCIEERCQLYPSIKNFRSERVRKTLQMYQMKDKKVKREQKQT